MDPWQEQYDGGSSEKERVLFDQLALDIMDVQLKIRQRNRASGIEEPRLQQPPQPLQSPSASK